MTTSFTFAILAWVFLGVSAATGDSCSLAESPRVLPDRYQELKSSSCPNQSKSSVRIKCMVFCPRHTQQQLNSTKQDDPQDANPPTEELTTVTKTEQETPTTETSATERVTTVSLELSTQAPDTTSAKTVDTEGPIVNCPPDVFGFTNDSNAHAMVQWYAYYEYAYEYAYDNEDGYSHQVTCRDDAEGITVKSGDFFKVGTTNVMCTASDAAGNPGQCTFVVTVTVCNMTRLGMESGAISDHQITAKNVLNNDYANYGQALARLNGKSSWCGQQWTSTWIQVDFLRTVDIYGLIIQGRYQSDEYVTEFYLKYGDDENSLMYAEDNYSQKLYASRPRSDGQDVLISVQTTSQRMIRTRFIRIEPLWYGSGNPCMRFEIVSCN